MLSRSTVTLACGALLGAFVAPLATAGPASAADHWDKPNVVGFGDSYASGEGAGDYRSYDGGVADCHKSSRAWIRHAKLPNGKKAWQSNFTHAACSGALASEITANGGKGTGRGAGQLSKLNKSTDYVFLSLGGNDAYFSHVLKSCQRITPGGDGCLDLDLKDGKTRLLKAPLKVTLPKHIKTNVRVDLTATLSAMKRRAPHAKFVWAGYPNILAGTKGCVSFSKGMQTQVASWNNLLFSTMKSVASDMRSGGMDITLTDTRPAFGNKGACNGGSGESHIQEIVGPPSMASSFHPNRLGQLDYASAVNPVSSKPSRTYGSSHTVKGGILTAAERRGSRSGVGEPSSAERCGLKAGGCSQRFAKGVMFWKPGNGGAKWSEGGILSKYAKLKYEGGSLGYPTNDHRCGLTKGGCWQSFENGRIMYSPKSGTRVLKGAILRKYRSLGSEKSWLGYPTSDEYDLLDRGKAVCQDFQSGQVAWFDGTVTVKSGRSMCG